MDANTSDPTPWDFDPYTQNFTLMDIWGDILVVSVADVDAVYISALNQQANYGAQAGACLAMFLVVLAMTPGARLLRAPALVNLAALLCQFVRNLLFCWWYNTSFFEFYAMVAGDYSLSTKTQYNTSAFSEVLGVPVLALVLAALAIQAWSMIQLWPAKYKWAAAGLSGALVLVTMAFCFMITVLNTRRVLEDLDAGIVDEYLWAHNTYLALVSTSIFWFCFLFNVRLVVHLWQNRDILPSARKVSAMEALVMTNGVLMIVPSLFAALAFAEFVNFEPGSLVTTSVIIVLPLGSLIAQRLAAPQNNSSAGSGSGGSRTLGQNSHSFGSGSHFKRPTLRSWLTYGRNKRRVSDREEGGVAMKPVGVGSGRAVNFKAVNGIDPVELELARIDDVEEDWKKGWRA